MYIVGESIGQGAFGHVYRVTVEQGSMKGKYVCKVEQRQQSDHASLLFEAWVIRKLNIGGVEGVVKLIDFVSESRHIAIVMDYGGPSL